MGLPDDDRVWRQVEDDDDQILWDGNRQRFVLRFGGSKAHGLQIDKDGISVYWREHLTQHGQGYSDVVAEFPNRPLTFEARVGDIRALRPSSNRVHVVYTPQGSTPLDCAHASVLPSGNPSTEEKRIIREALQAVLLHTLGESTVEIPEGA